MLSYTLLSLSLNLTWVSENLSQGTPWPLFNIFLVFSATQHRRFSSESLQLLGREATNYIKVDSIESIGVAYRATDWPRGTWPRTWQGDNPSSDLEPRSEKKKKKKKRSVTRVAARKKTKKRKREEEEEERKKGRRDRMRMCGDGGVHMALMMGLLCTGKRKREKRGENRFSQKFPN